jgi:hypothetical protein
MEALAPESYGEEFFMLAIIAALLFLIAFIVEVIHHPHADMLLITAGFFLVALYLGEIGPRRLRRFW